ncbi:hypothetical protein [Parageobacillus thermoglucosidasius]|uniref:Uncharacterized protein n=1 Tax=Parageobacillus thermoglucosidasius TaxID=1426 RepID=A0AB38QW58_PARTM|nr:hypothetical protein [Parageobacillus thermoglucosidasius]UOE74709.1 hypothetical protein IMI45_09915 [Parageobacillus thermoglucosidasius]
MSSFIIVLIIALAVLADFFWLDIDGKRWGWMKNWSKIQKIVFFIIISLAMYFGLSTEYF